MKYYAYMMALLAYCLAPLAMADEHKVKDYDWEEFNDLRQERDAYDKKQKELRNTERAIQNNQRTSPEIRDGLKLNRSNAPIEPKSDRLWDADSNNVNSRTYQMKK